MNALTYNNIVNDHRDENETHLAMWYKFFDSGLIQHLHLL